MSIPTVDLFRLAFESSPTGKLVTDQTGIILLTATNSSGNRWTCSFPIVTGITIRRPAMRSTVRPAPAEWAPAVTSSDCGRTARKSRSRSA
jgi:hypothetical protein